MTDIHDVYASSLGTIPTPHHVRSNLTAAARQWLIDATAAVAEAVARWEPGRTVSVSLRAPVPFAGREALLAKVREAGWRVLDLETGDDQRDGAWALLKLDAPEEV